MRRRPARGQPARGQPTKGQPMMRQPHWGAAREEILKYGLHDIVMGNPVVTIAVMRILEAADPSFK
jgi:abhydrolase domain-containing protein 12